MPNASELMTLLEELYQRLAQLDMSGELAAAHYLDQTASMLSRSIELLRSASDME